MSTTSPGRARSVPWTARDLAPSILLVLGTAFFGLLAISTLFVLLVALGGEEASPRLRGLLALILTVATEGGMVVALWLYALQRHRATWREIGFRPLTSLGALGAVPLALVLTFLGLSLYGLATRSLGWGPLQSKGLPTALLHDPLLLGSLLVLAVVVAPLIEEAFFRGFAFTALEPRWGTMGAAVLSSLLFGLAHVWPGLILPTAGLGLLLVYLFRRTGTLWTCVCVHGGFNALSLLLAL